MAVSQSQIVDLLFKEAFGVTKTDTATNKSPSNESIPSPSLIRGDTQWTQSDQIPATAAALAGIVQAYTGAAAVETVADNTTVPIGGIYPTWKTNLTYWIPSEFGATYNIQVWVDNPGVANPTSTGTQIFADGSGGTGQYYYNYQSGVLNFIGETIPAPLTSGKVLYIVGYRYIGLVGVTNLPSNTTIGNLNINGTTIISTTANSNIVLTPNGTGIVQISSGLTSNANITASFFIGNGSQLTGVAAGNAVTAGTVTASAQPNITSVGTLISLDVTGNITAGNANLGNLVTANFFSGDGGLLSNITGANVVGNVTSAVTANFANYAGNVTVAGQANITSVGTLTSLTVSGNGSFGNISTTGSGGNITGANVVSANTFSGNLLATSANVNGNLISLNANLGNAASANFFLGDGGFLTNVAAGNAVTAGTVTASAQPNITSVGTLISLDITGNLTAGNANLGNLVTANFFSGSGNLLSNIQGSNVTGNVTSAVTANFANFAGNVTESSQPNITSVGTLTGLSISGNIIPTIDVTYNLGNATNRFKDLYLSGNTINLGNSQVSSNTTQVVITNPLGGIFIVGGNGSVNSADLTGYSIANGNSNVSVNSNGNVYINANAGVEQQWIFNTNGNLTAPISGTINAGNLLIANFVQGTLTTNSQPNITSVGTLISLDITGNLTAGNANLGNAVTANYFIGSGNNLSNIQGSNITGNVPSSNTSNFANFAGNVTESSQPNITSVGTLSSLNVSGNANTGNLGTTNFIATGTGSFGGNVNLNSYWINNVGYPNLSTDAASKAYVDTMISSGIAYHQPVLAATTTTLAIATGGTTAYVQPNGSGNGIGSYISTTGSFHFIDTANVQTIGTRILVKDEANATWNGVYVYANTTAIIRASDADEYGPDSTEQLSVNDFFFTTGGNVNEGTGFVVSAPLGTITFGTSNITFAVFTTSQVYDAGTGLNLVGTTFNISNTAVTAGSYGNGDTVATFTVNGQGQLTAASNTTITANAANLTGTILASSIVTSSLTSVGTLISLDITGNLSAGNANLGNLVTANFFSGSGNNLSNIQGSNVTGNVTSASTANFANYAGNITEASQPNITSVGTLISLDVTGNIISGNVYANSGTVSASLLGGTLTTAAQPNITSVGILSSLAVTGNISSGNLTAGNIVAGVGAGGNITGANLISANYFTGTLTTSAQPNITSIGTLTSLTVSGTSNLGPVGNVTITGGTAGYYLQTNGSGVLSWADVPTGTGISNGTSNVNISTINGNITMAVNGNANIVTVTGTGMNVAGTANISGNVSVGNLSFGSGEITGTGNITAANLVGALANGDSNVNIPVAAGNVTISVFAVPNVVVVTSTGANISGTLNSTGNANVGNLGTGGLITATGNITGANLVTVGNVYAENIVNTPGNTSIGMGNGSGILVLVSAGNSTQFKPSGQIELGGVSQIVGGTFSGSGITVAGTQTDIFQNRGGNVTVQVGTGGSIANTWTFAQNGSFTSPGNINATTNLNVNLALSGNTANFTGNANVGNLGTGGLITATGNVSGGNINSSGTVTASSLISNVATGTAPLQVTSTTQVANLNVATAGTAGTVTTAAQANITSVGTLTGLTISGDLIANTFQMGYDSYAFYATSVYFATTASVADDQVLWSSPISVISAIDFTIIATNDFDGTRQSCKISAAVLGTTVVYNEYGGLIINGGVGNFGVVYNAGTSSIDLIVTPESSNLTTYNIMISKYLV